MNIYVQVEICTGGEICYSDEIDVWRIVEPICSSIISIIGRSAKVTYFVAILPRYGNVCFNLTVAQCFLSHLSTRSASLIFTVLLLDSINRKVPKFGHTVRGKESGWLVQHSTCKIGLLLGWGAFAGDVAVPTMLESLFLSI